MNDERLRIGSRKEEYMNLIESVQLTEELNIDDIKTFQTFYKAVTGELCDVEGLKKSCQDGTTVPIMLSNKLARVNTRKESTYVIIPTGGKDSQNNEVYISMRKSFIGYNGHIVDNVQNILYKLWTLEGKSAKYKKNIESLSRKLCKKPQAVDEDMKAEEDNDVSLPETDIDMLDEADVENTVATREDIYTALKSQLCINNWATDEGFKRFIRILGTRVLDYIDEGKTDYYLRNESTGALALNTGLLDKFGRSIHVLYYKTDMYNYRPVKIVESKRLLISEGFSVEDTNKELKPITFDTTTLSINIDDYDINYNSLEHCIEERRERFPESVQNISSMTLAQKLKQELDIGLNIHRCSGTYAKSIYKAKTRQTQWLLPLHINTNIGENPELVMVIAKRDSFYVVRTVLPYTDCISDWIRASNLYESLW